MTIATLLFSILALAPDSSRITGHCYNVADQAAMKCKVSIAFNGSRQILSKGAASQFAFGFPDSARHLIFEAQGFETRTIPINQTGNGVENAVFKIAVPMLQKGMDPSIKNDETIFPKALVLIHVEAPDTLTLAIVFQDESQRKLFEHRPVISIPAQRNLTLNYMLPGPFTLAAGLFDKKDKNRVNNHFSQKVAIREGFNFVKVRYRNVENGENKVLSVLQPRTLYFDQSSYKLKLESKLALDSVCATLAARPTILARVTGHTDNVGRAHLNLVLSEYRARVVQHYMKQNGVRPGQISIEWRGGSSPIALNDTEQNKAKNRRVELRFVDGR